MPIHNSSQNVFPCFCVGLNFPCLFLFSQSRKKVYNILNYGTFFSPGLLISRNDPLPRKNLNHQCLRCIDIFFSVSIVHLSQFNSHIFDLLARLLISPDALSLFLGNWSEWSVFHVTSMNYRRYLPSRRNIPQCFMCYLRSSPVMKIYYTSKTVLTKQNYANKNNCKGNNANLRLSDSKSRSGNCFILFWESVGTWDSIYKPIHRKYQFIPLC